MKKYKCFLLILSIVFNFFPLSSKGLDYGDLSEIPSFSIKTFTVNSTADNSDLDTTDNTCATSRGECTLRAAVEQFEAMSTGIHAITFSDSLSGETLCLDLSLDISTSMTINGSSYDITLDGGNGDTSSSSCSSSKISGAIFSISGSSTTVNIKNLTIKGGKRGIESQDASLNLDGVIITDNKLEESGAGYGGGIYFITGTLSIIDSTISKNSISASNADGGGIYASIATVTITNSEILSNKINGSTGTSFGGGIFLSPWTTNTINITGSTIAKNRANGASGVMGGGIYIYEGAVQNQFTLSSSVISANTGMSSSGYVKGGGLHVSRMEMQMDNSLISANKGQSTSGVVYGAGLYAGSDFDGTMVNSTISSNIGSAPNVMGGGVYFTTNNTLKISHSTIASNSAESTSPSETYQGNGGGLYVGGTDNTVSIKSSIVADNKASYLGHDFYGTLNSYGYNLIEIDSPTYLSYSLSGADSSTDTTGIDPGLGLLAENGGDTKTMAVGSSSAAIDNGSTTDIDGNTVSTDQREYTRDTKPDRGAFEYMADETNNCSDSADNDGDGFTDSIDSDCGGTETSCLDGSDNDGDLLSDCDDFDCSSDTSCTGSGGDGGDVCTETIWYGDYDGDGYGSSRKTASACSQPSGFVDNSDDCNDKDSSINPGGSETCGDGIDQDCEGLDTACASDSTTDDDSDGVNDEWDNCSLLSNSDQTDTDTDGLGNVCDDDDDGDGVNDDIDAFPTDASESIDSDDDGTGNNDDIDDDGDSIADIEDDDDDNDGTGDAEDPDADSDADGVADAEDAMPTDAAEYKDSDGDGQGDNADTDDDNDGIPDTEDIDEDEAPDDETGESTEATDDDTNPAASEGDNAVKSGGSCQLSGNEQSAGFIEWYILLLSFPGFFFKKIIKLQKKFR